MRNLIKQRIFVCTVDLYIGQLARSPRPREKLRLKDLIPCCYEFSSPTFGGCLQLALLQSSLPEAPQRSSMTLPKSQIRYFISSRSLNLEADWWGKEQLYNSLLKKSNYMAYFSSSYWLHRHLCMPCWLRHHNSPLKAGDIIHDALCALALVQCMYRGVNKRSSSSNDLPSIGCCVDSKELSVCKSANPIYY